MIVAVGFFAGGVGAIVGAGKPEGEMSAVAATDGLLSGISKIQPG